MRVRAAIGLGLVLVVGLLLVKLSHSEQRLAASNAQVAASGNDVPIEPGARACQPESVPAEATAVRVYVGTRAELAGPLDVSIRDGAREVSRGRFGLVADGMAAEAHLLPRTDREVAPAEVCFRNRGRSQIRLAGDRTPVRGGANPYNVLLDDEPRVDYLRSGDESWWALAGLTAERFGRAKTSFFGTWTMWAVLALVAGTWALGITVLLRRQPAR